MSPQQDVFNGAIELFASDQEDVRTAAAFAAGSTSFLSSLPRNLTVPHF
jgi:cullin-associated NEDD8-dissociated protein 1